MNNETLKPDPIDRRAVLEIVEGAHDIPGMSSRIQRTLATRIAGIPALPACPVDSTPEPQPALDVAGLAALTRRAIESAHYEGFQDGKTGNTYSSYDKSKALANSQSIATAITTLAAQLAGEKREHFATKKRLKSSVSALEYSEQQLAQANKDRDEWGRMVDRAHNERDEHMRNAEQADEIVALYSKERTALKEQLAQAEERAERACCDGRRAVEQIDELRHDRDALAARLAEAERDWHELNHSLSLTRDERDAANEALENLKASCSKQDSEIEQILGKALGYPQFKDDQANFPGATEADGVAVGEHVAVPLVLPNLEGVE